MSKNNVFDYPLQSGLLMAPKNQHVLYLFKGSLSASPHIVKEYMGVWGNDTLF